jgi:hypothetical protein
MTAENIVKHRTEPHSVFWRQLKEGYDRFEATRDEPIVGVVGGRYSFQSSKDADTEAKVMARRADEDARMAKLVAEGPAAVRTTYADGGQHPSFRILARQGIPLGEVSRPEALVVAGRELIVIAARPKLSPSRMDEAKAGPPKEWLAAPDLPSIQGALRPLPDPAVAV